MRPSLLLIPLVAAVLSSPPVPAWGNGAGGNNEFPYYGVHDAIAHVAYEKLRAHDAAAARWIAHWFLANPGGYGPGYEPTHLRPVGSDNFLGFTDDPDSVFQDWPNHLYMVHPRAGHQERGAPPTAERLVDDLRDNLTAWRLTGFLPCAPFEHAAAYHAGLLAHYVGDLSQFGHTDHTELDHDHPAVDPADRTYHGYYESQGWGTTGLRDLLTDQRARTWTPNRIADVPAAVVGLAIRTNQPNGLTVTIQDSDGRLVSVGSAYRDLLLGYVAAYDSAKTLHGMRGFTSTIWIQTQSNVAAAVDVLADLYYTAWTEAKEAAPLPDVFPPGPPGCPAG